MAKIQIIHMVLKNKLIRIYILPPFPPHTHTTWISIIGRTGDISVGENVRRRWICLDFVLSLCHRNALSLYNRTTVDMLCPVMDGAYFIEWCVLWDTGHEFFISEQGSAVTFLQRINLIFAPKNGWQYDRKRKLPVWRGVCKGYCPLGIDGATSQRNIYWFGAYNGCTWICKDKYPGNKLILSQSFIQFSHHPVIQAQGFCGGYPIADCFYHASITGSLTYPLPLQPSHDMTQNDKSTLPLGQWW